MSSVSVIIPTKDRAASLRRLLACLAAQGPACEFEVLVVDDSSDTEAGQEIVHGDYPFTLLYIRGSGSGAVGARNAGVSQARGEIIILLDDDMIIGRDFVHEMASELRNSPRAIVIADIAPHKEGGAAGQAPFGAIYANPEEEGSPALARQPNFTACLTGALAVRREHYWDAGGMRPLEGDSRGAWTDVVFGYHAAAIGLDICHCPQAIAYHDDHALTTLESYCQSMERGARQAPRLFQLYPDLQPYMPMFDDKTSIAWCQDRPRMIVRKLARQAVSSTPVLWGMEHITRLLEQRYPHPRLLRPLYRWIIGSYIYRGYRAGLRDSASASAQRAGGKEP